MFYRLKNPAKIAICAFILFFVKYAEAQNLTLIAPAEPNAIPLGTGGVDNQSASESWYSQGGDPMVRNVSTATLTPFLPEPGKANGAAVIVFNWLF